MTEINARPIEGSVQLQLDRILASKTFVRSERVSRFLRYTVDQTLQGHAEQIKESVIGVEVYDRGADYNPKTDPIVRNEARRLRGKLREYYETEGRNDSLWIDLPKGSYAPVFRKRAVEPGQRRSLNNLTAPIAAVVLAVAGASYWLTHRITKPVEPISIAVLPFVNLSSDPSNEYFSDGLTEELIDALTKVDGLRVPARTSAFAFKGKQGDIREIGSRLNVGMVLEGSVRKEGDKLRITAQLNKVADGYHLWSQTYDREMKDALAIQNEISLAIVTKLKVKLSDAGSPRRTGNSEAYTLYLKGRYFQGKAGPMSSDGQRKAIDYFRQAIEKDPTYALAYAGMSDSWNRLANQDPARLPEALPNAETAAGKALKLDDRLSEAHVSIANVRSDQWDWAGADREYKRALELDPNNASAHRSYAIGALSVTDRLDQALQEMKRAEELDPISPEIYGQFAALLHGARQYSQAIEEARKALEMNPRALGAQLTLGRSYTQQGMLPEARVEFEKAEAFGMRRAHWAASLAGLYVKSGRRAEAEQLLDNWKRRSSEEFGHAESMAMIYTGLGDKDEAFGWLEKAYQEHWSRLPSIKIDPEYDSLRPDPRFQSLLRRMGL